MCKDSHFQVPNQGVRAAAKDRLAALAAEDCDQGPVRADQATGPVVQGLPKRVSVGGIDCGDDKKTTTTRMRTTTTDDYTMYLRL